MRVRWILILENYIFGENVLCESTQDLYRSTHELENEKLEQAREDSRQSVRRLVLGSVAESGRTFWMRAITSGCV